MSELTKRQREVLEFIEERQNEDGLTPTYREIAARFRFSSVNAASAHVEALIAKGWLTRERGLARSFRLSKSVSREDRGTPPYVGAYNRGRRASNQIISIPIFGSIPAGLPQDAAEEQEGCVLIDIETVGIKPTARTFALKVRGDSMVGKWIVDGDIAVIEHGVEAKTGDVVAALIDGEVTLKTFVMQRGKPYLRAENAKYPDLIPRAELQVQGVMMALIRRRK